jgi:methyltransferase family protein
MSARTAGLNRAIRTRAKRLLGWDSETPGASSSTAVQRLLSDAVMHNSMDMALRYHPIVRYLKPRLRPGTRIVDVGSGSVGITPYLDHNVFGIDRSFDGPRATRLVRCTGDVLTLPFADRSVDVTLCVDTLEHLPPETRSAAVQELLRVTGKVAVIAVPCGPLSAQRDRDLSLRLRRRLARRDRFLDEHLEHGLPRLEDLQAWIADAGRKLGREFHARSEDNVDLRVWWLVQMAKVSLVWRAALIVSFPVAFPILRRFNGPPSYRQILYVEA